MLFLGEYTTACRVLRDEFLIDGPVHSVGNEAVNIAYRFGRQAFWLVLRFFSLYSAALAHAVVELLQVVGGELVQFDCSDRIVLIPRPSDSRRTKSAQLMHSRPNMRGWFAFAALAFLEYLRYNICAKTLEYQAFQGFLLR